MVPLRATEASGQKLCVGSTSPRSRRFDLPSSETTKKDVVVPSCAPVREGIVREPDRPEEIAIEGGGELRSAAAARGRDPDRVGAAALSAARMPVRDARAVRREHRLHFVEVCVREALHIAGGDFDERDAIAIRQSLVRGVAAGECDPLAVRRPGKRRRRGAGRAGDGETPCARGQSPRRAFVHVYEPHVRGPRLFAHQVVVVVHFERQHLLVRLRRLVRGHERELRSVRTPGELLHAARGVGETARLAAGDRHHPHLPLRVLVVCQERELRSVGRPSWRAESAALERQRALRAAGDVDGHELLIEAILLCVRAADDREHRFSVGRDLRVRGGHEPQPLVRLPAHVGATALSGTATAEGSGRHKDEGEDQAKVFHKR